MKTYLYIGETEVALNEYGVVKPGETIKTDKVINHPHFEEKREEKKSVKKNR